MTVKLVRGYAGLAAGSSYDGSADEEIDLVAHGNAVWDVRSVVGQGGPGDGVVLPALIDASARRYGGSFDGTSNNSSNIQDAIDDAAEQSPGAACVMLPPTICLRDQIILHEGVHLFCWQYTKGRINTQVKIHADASFSTGYILNCNTTDGTTPTVAPRLGQWVQCGVFGLWLNNSNPVSLPGMRLMLLAGTYDVRDIRGYKHTQLIKKMAGQYIDNGRIDTVYAAASYDNSEYAIDIGNGGGDALQINNLNFPGSNPVELALKVDTSAGCKVSNAINGQMYFVGCTLASVDNFHGERGRIVRENSSVSVRDTNFNTHTSSSAYPIDCVITAGTGSAYTDSLHLDNVVFNWGQGDGSSEGTHLADVRTTYQTAIHCDNVRRVVNMYGSQRTLTGILVAKQDDTLLDAFNNWSHFLSRRGSFVGLKGFGSFNVQLAADFTGINGSSASSSFGSSTLTTQTYYYIAQLLIDATTGALVGRNQSAGEHSKAVTAGQRVSLTCTMGSSSTLACIIRIYRGTSTGSYDKVANIPMMRAAQLVDKGSYVNGIPWTDRAAGAVDTITSTTGTWLMTPGMGKVAVA